MSWYKEAILPKDLDGAASYLAWLLLISGALFYLSSALACLFLVLLGVALHTHGPMQPSLLRWLSGRFFLFSSLSMSTYLNPDVYLAVYFLNSHL